MCQADPSIRACLPAVAPFKSGGSNIATAAKPFPAAAPSCLSPMNSLLSNLSQCKMSYNWLFSTQCFAHTLPQSSWTCPNKRRYSLAIVAVHLLKLCCSLCRSPLYLQHSFFAIITVTSFILKSHDAFPTKELQWVGMGLKQGRSLSFKTILGACNINCQHLPSLAFHYWCEVYWHFHCLYTLSLYQIVKYNCLCIYCQHPYCRILAECRLKTMGWKYRNLVISALTFTISFIHRFTNLIERIKR